MEAAVLALLAAGAFGLFLLALLGIYLGGIAMGRLGAVLGGVFGPVLVASPIGGPLAGLVAGIIGAIACAIAFHGSSVEKDQPAPSQDLAFSPASNGTLDEIPAATMVDPAGGPAAESPWTNVVPACPRCKAPTVWVAEHARHLCERCALYVGP